MKLLSAQMTTLLKSTGRSNNVDGYINKMKMKLLSMQMTTLP